MLVRARDAGEIVAVSSTTDRAIPGFLGRVREILYRHEGHHPSCWENLQLAFQPFGIDGRRIGTTFNIFMNVAVDPAGSVTVGVPSSKAGDHIDLVAEMDMVVALTACSAEKSNNGTFKPIDCMVFDA